MPRLRTFVRCSIILFVTTTACNETVAPRGGGSMTDTRLVITPGQARLAAVGDTMRLRAGLYDADGGPLAGSAVSWTSANPDIFTIDQSGLVTGKRALSVGRAIASASGKTDTAYVVVANPDASPCLGYSAPVALAVGEAITVSMSDGACITSAGGGDEYIVVPWYGTASRGSTVSLDVTGDAVASPASSPSRVPLLASRALYRRTGLLAQSPTSISRDLSFERGIRELGRRELIPLASRGRAELARRKLSPTLATNIPTYLTIGDLVQLNASPTSCTSPVFRTGRVTAASARAIVVADTGNPAGGFTDLDYARIATAYDTLIARVEDAAFGTPTDIDANGKVVIFFTRATNELTPAAASSIVAGYFHPRDLLPRTYLGEPFCPGSNEREMFYMPVPDPDGVVNGNTWSASFIDSLTMRTLAHENQHLVNFGRRLYVNDAVVDEEPWLNEGLSDIAEELVFYHAVGLSPRQNIGAERFGTQPFDGLFDTYMASKFANLAVFLRDPQSYSPYSSDYDPGTRGAAWAFLRYAADRQGSVDADIWLRLANSRVSGLNNLFDVFGADVPQMLNAWSVSLYTDDVTAGLDAAYTQPSWNFRSAFPALPTASQPYPLLGAVHVLSDRVSQTISLHGGSSSFFRFSISAGKEAVIRLASGGQMPPPGIQATIVRAR